MKLGYWCAFSSVFAACEARNESSINIAYGWEYVGTVGVVLIFRK